MTDILGHDIDGRPLRAGDLVVHIRADDVWARRFLNCWVVITGVDATNPPMMTTDLWFEGSQLLVDGTDVRKLTDDLRPVDESFEDTGSRLKEVHHDHPA